MKDRFGTNYRPVLKIVQWAERPKDLPNQSPVEAGDVWSGVKPGAPAAAKAPAQHVPPPAQKPADPLSESVF